MGIPLSSLPPDLQRQLLLQAGKKPRPQTPKRFEKKLGS